MLNVRARAPETVNPGLTGPDRRRTCPWPRLPPSCSRSAAPATRACAPSESSSHKHGVVVFVVFNSNCSSWFVVYAIKHWKLCRLIHAKIRTAKYQ